jgi:hypothetical protein
VTAAGAYRVRIIWDDDMDWSWLDQDWGDEPNPFEGMTPDDYYAYGVITEKACEFGEFHAIDSLWGVTFLTATNVATGTFDMDDVARWELGDDEDHKYVASIVRDAMFAGVAS